MFNVPVVQIRQRSSQLEYEIKDGDDRVLGRATQVAGPTPRKGLLAVAAGSGLGEARVVVQVTDAFGQSLCYVDFQPYCPVAIMSADGRVLGRYDEDRSSTAREAAAGDHGMLRRVAAPGLPMCHRLIDPEDRPVCRLSWRRKRVGETWRPVGCRYTDLGGRQIGDLDYVERTYKDRYRLELAGPLPEPLRTLVIASPIAFDLMRS